MVKILDFKIVRNFWQKVIVYMFSLLYVCLDFHKKSVCHKPLSISNNNLLLIRRKYLYEYIQMRLVAQ